MNAHGSEQIRHSERRLAPLCVIITVTILTGCTTTGPSRLPTPNQPDSSRPADQCQYGHGDQTSPLIGHGRLTMRGLVMTTQRTFHTGDSIKFVWRITGHGPARFSATGPAGTPLRPDWGPESHGTASNFSAPGDEWGMAFTFPAPGCWTINASRGRATSQAGVEISAR